LPHAAFTRDELTGSDPVSRLIAGGAREHAAYADRTALDLHERRSIPDPERVGEQRVVAERGVGVERQVVGGEAHVALEQHAEPTGHAVAERLRSAAPEEPVVAEHELRAVRGGALEELQPGRDPGRHGGDILAARHLQTVGAVVGEGPHVEQLVELVQDFVA
jgi:hypothetical protein